MESFIDSTGSPWPARSPLPAGTRAIEYQSRCAFRAYAELRLASVPLGEPRPGIDARERGRLLHRALELLWEGLGDSRALEAESRDGSLPRRIEGCVERAAEEIMRASPQAGLAPLAAASRPRAGAHRRERERTVRVLIELAELERRRPPFRVLAIEHRERIAVGGATLDVRIDRMDELEDGTAAIFDYKTGKPASPDWLAERVSDPQLLVYSLVAGTRVAALAMIHLTPKRIAFRGMADRRDRLPRIDAPADAAAWAEQMRRWHEAVGRLAQQFLSGSAHPDPLGNACQVCHLHGLCRIAELAGGEGGGAAEAAGERDGSED